MCGNGSDDDCDGSADPQDPGLPARLPRCGRRRLRALRERHVPPAPGDACGDCNDAQPQRPPGGKRALQRSRRLRRHRGRGESGGGPACETGRSARAWPGTWPAARRTWPAIADASATSELCASGRGRGLRRLHRRARPDCIADLPGATAGGHGRGRGPELRRQLRSSDPEPRPGRISDGDATGDACETGAVAADIDRSGPRRRAGSGDAGPGLRPAVLRRVNYTAASDLDRNCICDGEDPARLAAAFGRNH